jgi:soluble lytic murein transglycosylase-like protein
MQTNVASWTMAAVGAALISGSGDALAPAEASDLYSCVPDGGPAATQAGNTQPLEPAQRVLVEYLSRRYTIAAAATERMVGAAHRAAREVGLDPLLVLAVISVESRFNPIAESVMGAKGLMQIIPKYHLAKLDEFGGEEAVLDPESNILIGSRILQEYVYRTGTLEAGLQFYNGAFRDGTAQYAHKVMAERERLELVVHPKGRI